MSGSAHYPLNSLIRCCDTVETMEIPKGFKKTEVGVIPSDWEVKDISELCLLQRGFDITEATRKPGSVPVYSSSGLSYFNDRAMVNPPGVVTGRKGILGKVFYIEEPFWPHDTTLWVKDFKGNVPKYVYWYLSFFRLERFDAATSVPTLNRNNLVGIPIPLPTLDDQRTIAEALNDADALISSLESLIAKKRSIKQGAMQELLKPKVGWEVKKLEEIGECIIGLTYSPSNISKDGKLVLRSSNIDENKLVYNDNVYVNIEIPEKIVTRKGDILICVRNGSRNLIGKCAYIDGRAIGETFGAFMSVFRSPYNQFIFYVFQSNIIKGQIDRHLGATINQITNKSLNSFEIPFPVKNEQTRIAQILSDMDAEIEALEKKLEKYRLIKQGMMQNLLTGRIRLV